MEKNTACREGEPAGPIDEDAIKGDAKAAAYRAEPLELFDRVFDGRQYGNGLLRIWERLPSL